MDNEEKRIFGLKTEHFLISLFLISFVLRVAYTLFLRLYVGREIMHDELKYHELGKNLLEFGYYGQSGMFDKAYYTPGYPLFLSGIYNIYGVSTLIAGFINSLFSSLIPPLIYLLASKFTGHKASALAGVISVFDPYFIYYSPLLLTETILTFLPLLSLLWLFVALEKNSLFYLSLSGLIMGISTMVKPVTLLFPLIAVLYLVLQREFLIKKFIKQSLVYMIFFSAVCTPWVIRNYHVFGTPLVTTSKMGRIFFGANHFRQGRTDANMGSYAFNWRAFSKYFRCEDAHSEVSIDRAMMKAGFDELKQNYTKIPYLELRKFINFWGVRPDPTKEKWTFNDSLSLSTYGIILLFFVIGFFKTFKTRDKIFILHLTIIMYTVSALVFWGTPRFRFPISPYIIIIASMVVVGLLESYKSKLKPGNKPE